MGRYRDLSPDRGMVRLESVVVSIALWVPFSVGLRHGWTGLAWPFLGLLLTSEAAGEGSLQAPGVQSRFSSSLATLLGKFRVNWSSRTMELIRVFWLAWPACVFLWLWGLCLGPQFVVLE